MRLIQTVKERIMKNGLPEGYTRLEYLQSTGVQYIDTGIKFDCANTKIELKTYEDSLTRVHSICGDDGNCFYYFRGTGNWAVGYNNTASNVNSYMVVGDNVFVIDKNKVYLNSVLTTTYTASSTISSYNTLLFNRKTSLVDSGAVTMYYCKIWDNDTLVRDFIPALDPSDKPCMYDLVSKQPFYNQGTEADFTVGKKLYPVEYIANTGSSYINTGVEGNQVGKIIATVKSTDTSASSDGVPVGCGSGNERLQIYGGTYVSQYWSCRDDGTVIQSTTAKIVDKTTITLDTINKVCIFDNETKSYTASGLITSDNLLLFRRSISGTGTADAPFVGCIYKVQIWNKQNVLVRDLIPVRDENNVGYMLDLLTNTLYANAGSGSFAIGEDDLFVRNIGRTKFFKQTTRKVPRGFQEVEYLESDGNQYIDTEVLGNGEFDVDYMYYQTQDQSNAIFAGTRSASQHLNFGQRSNGSTGAFSMAYLGEYWQAISSPAINTNVRVQISYKNGSQTGTLNGTVMTSKSLTGTEATNLSIYIFKRNHYSTDNVTGLVGRIYYFKLWNNGALVRDFVPYLDASGRPCMWDKVEGKPYYNLGTGEFSYGRKIIPVEYLESTGEQYIDTGIKGKNNIDFDYKVNFTNVTTSSGYGIGGEWESQKSLYLGLIRSNGNFAYHYANTNAPVVVLNSVSANTDYSIQGHMWSGEQYMVINSTKSAVGTITGTFEATQSITLFRVTSSSPIYCYAKIYYLKIWDNNTLVRDFIPCIDENNVPYMFDKVTHSAFLNQGTGQFSYGDAIKERTETLRAVPIIRHLPLNYLESTGTQYIDTGYMPKQDTKVECKLYNPTDFNISKQGSILFGARDYGTLPTFTVIGNILNKYGTRWDYGDSVLEKLDFPLTVGEHTIIKDKQYNYLDGVLVVTNVTSTFSIGYTMHIFGTNTNGTNTLPFVGKYYYFKIYNDGVLIRDFIPVLKLPERTPCMYDRVSKTYFYNESTDPFLYG